MARHEKIVNNSTTPTKLSSGITAAATAITVVDGTLFPSEGDCRAKIDNEVLLVTARSGNILTVVRGVDGTTATAHDGSAPVNIVLSAIGIEAYIDNVLAGASTKQAARLLDDSGNTLTHSSFTFDNEGSAFKADGADGSIILGSDDTATSGSDQHVLYKSAPTAPWKVTAGFIYGLGCKWVTLATTAGLLCRENSTGEFILCSMAGGGDYATNRFTDPTTFSATVGGSLTPDSDSPWVWFQIEDDNSDLFWRVSHDGINFHQLATEGRTAFMAGGPDQIGFAISERGIGAATPRHEMHLVSWLEE